MEKIRVLAISTSMRKNRNTEKLVKEILKGAQNTQSVDIETEFFSVIGKNLNPCLGCNACKKGSNCPLNDDITELYQKIAESDVIIWGSPVFFYDISSQCKLLIDRSYAYLPINGNKVSVVALTAGSIGAGGSLKTMMSFFGVHGITYAGFVASYGSLRDKIKAKESALLLGEKAVKMALFQKNAPEDVYTPINHYAYGTHTF